VDLTKYIEEHNFNFDAAFDETVNNEAVIVHFIRSNFAAI